MKLSVQGESAVCRWLDQQGFRILERNFRCRLGEIDIIAEEGDTLCFVEVKTRTNLHYGRPVEAITRTKQHHILRTISFYCISHPLRTRDLRIDVAEVLFLDGRFYLHYIRNAFS